MTVSLAAKQGYSQARIQLAPAALGGIRIHLQQGPDGVVARVIADHAAAAQALQHGSSELHRSLESAGVSVLKLDIEVSDQRGPGSQGPGAGSPGARGNTSQTDPGSAEDTQQATPESVTVELPNGALVDVLA